MRLDQYLSDKYHFILYQKENILYLIPASEDTKILGNLTTMINKARLVYDLKENKVIRNTFLQENE